MHTLRITALAMAAMALGPLNAMADVADVSLQTLDFDFCGGREISDFPQSITLPAEAELAISLSDDEVKGYTRVTAKGIYFNFNASGTVEVFVRKVSDGTILATGKVENPSGWTEVVFDEPFKLLTSQGSLLVGISAPEGAEIPLAALHHRQANNIRFIGEPDAVWLSGYEAEKGAFPIGLMLEAESIPVDARIREVEYTLEPLDGVCHVKGYIENMSVGDISEYVLRQRVSHPFGSGDDIVCAIASDFVHAITSDDSTVAATIRPKELFPFEVDVAVPESGMFNIEVYTTKINGTTERIPSNGTGLLTVYSGGISGFKRRVVVEEGTGTWCGNCTMGIAAIDRMKRKYPDTFIPISLHYDNMQPLDSYAAIQSLFSSLPASIVDRKASMMPYPTMEAFESLYLEESTIAGAEIIASAEFADSQGTTVNIHTESVFGEPLADGRFTIGVVVLEDNVGPAYQSSYYTAEQLGMDYNFTRMMYNDVARDIHYPSPSSPGGDIAGFTPGEPVCNDILLPVPRNVMDISQMHLAILLINQKSGEIENAYACGISPYSSVGIKSVDGGNDKVSLAVDGDMIHITGALGASLYSPTGALIGSTTDGSLRAPAPGLYIVRTSTSSHRVFIP